MNGDLVHTTSRDTITVTMRTQVHGHVFDERIGVDARSGHAVLLDRPGFGASESDSDYRARLMSLMRCQQYQYVPTHPSVFKIEP